MMKLYINVWYFFPVCHKLIRLQDVQMQPKYTAFREFKTENGY